MRRKVQLTRSNRLQTTTLRRLKVFNRTKHLGTRRAGSHFDLLEDEINDTVEDQEDFVWMPHRMWNIELLCVIVRHREGLCHLKDCIIMSC